MKNAITQIVVAGFMLCSCGTKNDSPDQEISGTYAREYSYPVIHPETGAEIGMRTIRDTIFIRPFGDEFEVSNHKWFRNGYDREGWRNMEHSENRPKPTYISVYIPEKGSLTKEIEPDLHLEDGNRVAYWHENSKYQKVQ